MHLVSSTTFSTLPIEKRDSSSSSSSYPTDANGCVICPNTPLSCPKCKKGEECQQRTPTCHSCTSYYCAPVDGSSSSSTPVGGIVGGVVGGVVLIALLAVGFWYYKYVYRKKYPVSLDGSDDVMMDGMDDASEYEGKEDITSDSATSPGGTRPVSGAGAAAGLNSTSEKPPQRRANSNRDMKARRRLSSYESFTRPKTRYARKNSPSQIDLQQRRERQRQIADQANRLLGTGPAGNSGGVYLDPLLNRNSVATLISTTNASNILPIAYIPGVTVRPTKNNTRSIYLYESDSIFSDLNTIENASIIGDVQRANNAGMSSVQTGVAREEPTDGASGTMTAIKAQPRLVNVDRIDEEEEEESDDDRDMLYQDDLGGMFVGLTNHFRLAEQFGDAHSRDTMESDDSDVDSDIGEITRATSVKRPTRNHEVLLDIAAPHGESGSPVASTNGSFILDVEMDEPKKLGVEMTRETSPFDDPK